MRQGLRFRVAPAEDGARLDAYLRARLPDLPPRSVRYAIEAGQAVVSGRKAPKGLILREGEEVLLREVPEDADWLPAPGDVPGARVLFADAHVAVFDKPPGVHVEPHRPREAGTLAGYLRHRYPDVVLLSRSPGLTLLTRLDFPTSGAVPAALTREAFAFLLAEREEGMIRKDYLCRVVGALDGPLSIDFRIDARGGETVRVRRDAREKDERLWTAATPVRRIGPDTLVSVRIRRGKRHQIRAHLAAAGFPISGDRLYGGEAGRSGPGRLLLHAAEVTFRHPSGKGLLTVRSPLPPEFEVT